MKTNALLAAAFAALVLLMLAACTAEGGGETGDPGVEPSDGGGEVGDIAADLLDAFDAADETEAPAPYPLEDVLRFNHVQALGTHNSYHIQPENSIPPWNYTRLPLDQQASQRGVRQFELDAYYDKYDHLYRVYHIPFFDAVSTCDRLVDCLADLKSFSDGAPGHHPMHMLLEMKTECPSETEKMDEMLATLEAEVASVWPRERLLTPDDVQRDKDNVRDGLAAYGWPTLGELRGKLMIVLHEGGCWRDRYTEGGTTTAGRLLFPDAYGNVDAPYAAHHSLNDPIGDIDKIHAAVEAGHLVRTRADSDSEEALANDTTRRDAALASGANFISTDYPGADREGYSVVMPGGTPSRCNPLSAPAECTSEAIEDPALLYR